MDDRFTKSPCTKCGKLTYHICYIGLNMVCTDCFEKACEKKEKKNKETTTDASLAETL